MISPPKANPFQAKIRKLYLMLFRFVKTDKAKLNIAKSFGNFAIQNYTGHFREPEIETFLSDYGNRRFKNTSGTILVEEKILIHIITKTFEIGGHSRFLENLLKIDDKHNHHLIISDQGETTPRKNIFRLINQQRGTITHLEGSIDDKSKQLIETISALGGKIMLHHHPNDIIPSISLSLLRDNYPIFFFNHSDHTYSFGFELNPVVINIREKAAWMTYNWRRCEKNTVLPLPIIKPEIKYSREEVLLKYGLNPELKLGLCVAGMHKLMPNPEYNFFRTMYKALNENEDLQICVVGVMIEKIRELHLMEYEHPRFYFLDTNTALSELQAHADVAIDPIPMGSYTAFLETIYYGAYPLTCYNSPPLFDLTQDPALKNHFQMARDEKEYLNQLKSALNTFDSNDQSRLKDIFCKHHCGERWNEIYQNSLQSIDLLKIPNITNAYSIDNKPPAFSQKKDKIKYSFIKCGVSIANNITLYLKIIIAIHMVGAGFTLNELKSFLKSELVN
jgi:hypothetical protein